ncbi:NYN domain-containing protein [Psychrobacter alimentarius]|uniref:NYN domain-containing protein n=1 Tax=Psychrobacter alimentarius TaxID=261164 RepID=UPI001918E6F7
MKKFAVLIDADNSSHRHIEPILEEIAKYGIASVKRIYGDWSIEALLSWRDKLLPNAITPVQQFAYVTQKDATDMRLVIDAMDILYAGDLDGFCIVSSDSDFTPLASRIRENGLLVYGFGRQTTVKSFVNACDKFIYVENLLSEPENKTSITSYSSDQVNSDTIKVDRKIVNSHTSQIDTEKTEIDIPTLNLIYKAIKDNSNDEGWASLAVIGNYINNVKPDFDTRTYGRAKLSGLLKKLIKFECKIEDSHMFVRKFNFPVFIEIVRMTVNNMLSEKDVNEKWVNLSDLIEQLKSQMIHHTILAHLSEHEMEQKILAIDRKYINLNSDKNLISITT